MASRNEARPQRKSIRLRNYDYRQNGVYFVTICSANMVSMFGNMIEDSMYVSSAQLNDFGRIVQEEWDKITALRSYVELDASVVMPNHFHGIVTIHNNEPNPSESVGAQRAAPLQGGICELQSSGNVHPGPVSGSLGAIVRGFKSAVTKRINELRGTPGGIVWQRNYYEHIIRSESELESIRAYIEGNPGKWLEDRYYMRG